VKHTPGPWSSDMPFIVAPDPSGTFNDIYIATIADSDEEGRCEQDEDTLVANAHLIAAAPDLLSILQDLSESCGEALCLTQAQLKVPQSVWVRMAELNNVAVQMIQKAKGETNG
jgi:hypothetical protein